MAPTWWDGATPSRLSDAALPLAAAWTIGARVREALAPSPLRVSSPVICIGSVLVGGAGKTPVAMAVANRLLRAGEAPNLHFISRGYGGTARGPLRVDPAQHNADMVGDEPLMLSEIAPTWVAARRSEAAAAACASGASMLVMDDGLQHLSLHRDVSLLCVDSSYLFGNGRVLPAGPLREPPERALMRSDGVVAVTPVGAEAPSEESLRDALSLPHHLPLLRAAMQLDERAAADLAGREVVAFSGTARPQRFFDALKSIGCSFACEPIALPDHAPLDAELMRSLFRIQRAKRHHRPEDEYAAPIVTTVKDAYRLSPADRARVHQLPVGLRWLGGSEQALDQLIQPLIRAL